MANIRVDVNYTIQDGSEIVFRSPVDCSAITGLIVYYPGEDENTTSKELALADAHGSNVGDIDHLFAENVVVKVILDVTSGMAFVQNADTNAYIERTFVKTVNGKTPDQNGNVNVEGGGTGGVTDEQIATAVEAYMAENPAPKGDPFTYEDFTEEQLADLKGPKGDPGKSVTITHIAESDGDGAINMVAFSDGKTLAIKNGSKGSPGTTPHIGENGNWWVGETDTGVSAGGSVGNSDIIYVTIDWDTMKASMTSHEIMEAVTNGKTVMYKEFGYPSVFTMNIEESHEDTVVHAYCVLPFAYMTDGVTKNLGFDIITIDKTGAVVIGPNEQIVCVPYAGTIWDVGKVLSVTGAGVMEWVDPSTIPALKGDPGYTPVKGTDYWTAADKTEMVNDVLAALPIYNGEVVEV